MNKFPLFLILAFATSAFAERGLTPVTREQCVSFPKITPAAQMKKDLHYSERTYCGWENSDDSCGSWETYLTFKYYYFQKSTVDYYSAAGKLVTTNKESIKLDLTATASTVGGGVDALQLEIEKTIYTNSDPVCADSFYK